MFDRIAPVYDVMNRVMTAGLDQRWRRLTAAAVVRRATACSTRCCGTGDLAVAARKAGARRSSGSTSRSEMLVRARRKAPELEWVRGDLLALPFEDGAFDAATVGFGIRNVDDLERRAARAAPGPAAGRAARDPRDHAAARAAEPLLPALVRPVVPLLGKVLPGGAAYTYLPASVRRFPGPEELAARMSAAGFGDVALPAASRAGSSRSTPGVAR